MIGKKIQELRKSRNLTQEDLSERLGISRSSLSLYEINKREPDGDTLLKIVDYFNVSLDYLFDREISQNDIIYDNSSLCDHSLFTQLSQNEQELLEIFNRVKNEREQIKLIGRFDEIVEQMTGNFKSDNAQSTPSKKNVG